MKPNKRSKNRLLLAVKAMFIDDFEKKQTFYRNFTKEFDLEFFKKNFKQDELVLLSPNELRFNNFIDFETTSSEFINLLGRPKYSEISYKNPKIKSFVFKAKIAGIGTRCSVIFHKNKLVLFNYVFTNLDKKEKSILKKYSVEKFGNQLTNKRYQIMDAKNNSLFISEKNNSIIFNFYAPSKTLKKTFDCKPKEKKVISLKEVQKLKTSNE